jgi:hypothetical protein
MVWVGWPMDGIPKRPACSLLVLVKPFVRTQVLFSCSSVCKVHYLPRDVIYALHLPQYRGRRTRTWPTSVVRGRFAIRGSPIFRSEPTNKHTCHVVFSLFVTSTAIVWKGNPGLRHFDVGKVSTARKSITVASFSFLFFHSFIRDYLLFGNPPFTALFYLSRNVFFPAYFVPFDSLPQMSCSRNPLTSWRPAVWRPHTGDRLSEATPPLLHFPSDV